jgi:hypothetical protein
VADPTIDSPGHGTAIVDAGSRLNATALHACSPSIAFMKNHLVYNPYYRAPEKVRLHPLKAKKTPFIFIKNWMIGHFTYNIFKYKKNHNSF